MFRSCSDIERPSASSETPRDTMYKCNFCQSGWESETDVYIHRTREHEKDIQKLLSQQKAVCLICFTTHSDQGSLYKHINSEHLLSSEDARRVEREIFICDYCYQIFFNKQMLVVHQAHVHKARRRRELVDCPRCLRQIRTDTMWSHFEYHRLQSVSCCPICLTKCSNREDLKKHVSGHARHYYCELCAHAASKAASFRAHLRRHRAPAALPARARARPEEHYHRFFVPRDNEPWTCQNMSVFKGLIMPGSVRICILCREICRGSKEMRNHILSHGAEPQEHKKRFLCSCGEEFFNRVLLTQHTFKLKDTHKAVDD